MQAGAPRVARLALMPHRFGLDTHRTPSRRGARARALLLRLQSPTTSPNPDVLYRQIYRSAPARGAPARSSPHRGFTEDSGRGLPAWLSLCPAACGASRPPLSPTRPQTRSPALRRARSPALRRAPPPSDALAPRPQSCLPALRRAPPPSDALAPPPSDAPALRRARPPSDAPARPQTRSPPGRTHVVWPVDAL